MSSKAAPSTAPLRRVARFSSGFAHVPVRGAPGLVRGTDVTLSLPEVPVAFERFLANLPAPPPDSREALERWGAIGVEALDALASAAVLEDAVVDAAGATCACARRPMLPVSRPPEGSTASLSPLTCFCRDGTGWLLLGAVSRAAIAVDSEVLQRLIEELSIPTPIAGLSPVALLLLDQGLLRLKEVQTRFDTWSFHDALFHAASVHGFGTSGGYGARRDAARPNRPADLLQPVASGLVADTDTWPELRVSFVDVLARRQTCRTFAVRTIPLETIEVLLRLALRQRTRGGATADGAFHGYPSGGARGEITTFVVTTGKDHNAVARYDDEHDVLRRVETAPGAARRMNDLLCGVCGIETPRPSVALLFAADYEQMSDKYEAIAYATILRNVGAIYQTVSLCAEALGIGNCCVGGGWSTIEREVLAEGLHGRIIVGAMLLGARVGTP